MRGGRVGVGRARRRCGRWRTVGKGGEVARWVGPEGAGRERLSSAPARARARTRTQKRGSSHAAAVGARCTPHSFPLPATRHLSCPNPNGSATSARFPRGCKRGRAGASSLPRRLGRARRRQRAPARAPGSVRPAVFGQQREFGVPVTVQQLLTCSPDLQTVVQRQRLHPLRGDGRHFCERAR